MVFFTHFLGNRDRLKFKAISKNVEFGYNFARVGVVQAGTDPGEGLRGPAPPPPLRGPVVFVFLLMSDELMLEIVN